MKNRILNTFLLLGFVVVLFSGCTMTNHSMREPNAHMQWHKADFSYSGQVSAEASTTKILMIDWQRLFKKESGTIAGGMTSIVDISSLPVIGQVLYDRTSSYALYKLMQDNPGYDVIFYPQYEVTNKYPSIFRVFFQKTDVKVTARLAKIN
jgi:phosphoribosylamine-glycine ligase